MAHARTTCMLCMHVVVVVLCISAVAFPPGQATLFFPVARQHVVIPGCMYGPEAKPADHCASDPEETAIHRSGSGPHLFSIESHRLISQAMSRAARANAGTALLHASLLTCSARPAEQSESHRCDAMEMVGASQVTIIFQKVQAYFNTLVWQRSGLSCKIEA